MQRMVTIIWPGQLCPEEGDTDSSGSGQRGLCMFSGCLFASSCTQAVASGNDSISSPWYPEGIHKCAKPSNKFYSVATYDG